MLETALWDTLYPITPIKRQGLVSLAYGTAKAGLPAIRLTYMDGSAVILAAAGWKVDPEFTRKEG